MGWIGGVIGGIIGYLFGLFFKSWLILLWYQGLVLGHNPPSFGQYFVSTFIPVSTIDFIRFFTIGLPFALLGVVIGLVMTKKVEPPATPGAESGGNSLTKPHQPVKND